MTKYSPSLSLYGSSVPPSAPDAACPSSTRSASESSKPVEMVLVVMLRSLLRETYNPDVLYLAMRAAKDDAMQMGIEEAVFDEVMLGVVDHWNKNSSVMRKMFE